MVILFPGKYTVDSRSRAAASSALPGATPRAGAAIWIPMRSFPPGSTVMGSAALDLGERQILRHCGRDQVGKCRAPRKMLEQEAIQVVVVRGGERSAFFHEPG